MLRVFSIEIAASDKTDINEEDVVIQLRKVRSLRSLIFDHFVTWHSPPLRRYEGRRRVVRRCIELRDSLESNQVRGVFCPYLGSCVYVARCKPQSLIVFPLGIPNILIPKQRVQAIK